MEVTSRTKDGTALSGVSKGTSRSFDLRTWQGLTELLKAGRESGMDPVAYAEFRDLVLQYAQSGGSDASIRKKLESILPMPSRTGAEEVKEVEKPEPIVNPSETVKVEVEPAKGESSLPAQGVRIGNERPTPVFGGTKVAIKTPAAVPLEVVEEKVHQITFVPAHIEPEKQAKEVTTPAPIVTVPNADVPPVQTPVTPPVAPVVTSTEVASAPEKIKEENVKTIDEYRARISEIKRTVNAEIGNPVMLIDSNNTLGREYMTALLNAMKATSGGAPGSLVSSMEALERIFASIMKDAVNLKQAGRKEKAEEAVVLNEVEVTDPEDAVPEVLKEHGPLSGFTGGSDEIAAEVSGGEEKEQVLERAPLARVLPSLADQLRGVSQKEPVVHDAQSTEKREQPPVGETPKPRMLVPENASPALAAEVGKHAAKGSGLPHNDVTVPWNEKPTVPPSASEDLTTPEIDMGLQELLVQWSIFKGSGLFGTGPGGVQHPLFLKLQDMHMSGVAAGKWEKASKDEILSIRDYINGWRHEQGVSYIPTETFDHYLRRVVKRILKRQGI